MDAAQPWETIVIGGGAAGLSAALVLGRARRRVLVVDAGEPSNRFANGIGGLLGHNERPPAELYADGRREVLAHPTAAVLNGTVDHAAALPASDGPAARFGLTLTDGRELTAATVILATGMHYDVPELPGFAERWGRSVFHCPFCHGWEVRGRALGVLGDGPGAVHRALLLRAWSDDITVYLTAASAGAAPTTGTLTSDEEATLTAAGVRIEREPVAAIDGPGSDATHVLLADGTSRPCGGLLIATVLRQRSPLAATFGAAFAPASPIVHDAVGVDPRQGTNVPGLFAAGDVSTQMPQITSAIATGVMAGAATVGHLVST